MSVVHAFITPTGEIGMWAEAPRRAHRRSRAGGPHPFATPPPIPGTADVATLTLPSLATTPLPSPDLGGGPVRGQVQLRPWQVPVVRLPPGDDPESYAGQDESRVAGASVGALSDVIAFGRDLATRGRVVPGIRSGRAQWHAALAGADVEHLDALVQALPEAALAGTDAPRYQAVRDALDVQVDAFVRERLGAMALEPEGTRGVTAAWLHALTGPVGAVAADAVEVDRLAQRLERWRGSGARRPVRTCLRLRPPDDDDQERGWLLEFLLQPVGDPSVLVRADEVWAGQAAVLSRWLHSDPAGMDAQETLLHGLGRAARLYPDLEEALYVEQPTHLDLDVAGAHRFLTHSPVLEAAGFGVLVPARWQRRTELGLGLNVHTGQTTPAVLRDRTADLASVVDFRWGLALGGEYLTEEELTAIARAKVPLVRLRGEWALIDRDRLAAGLTFLARGGTGQITAGEALRLVHRVRDGGPALPVTIVDGTGWVADLLTGRTVEHLPLIDAPAGLATELRPYQRRGLSWLAFLDRLGIGALLADDMGLGKTVQLLALEALLRADEPRPPTLVVCPLSVLGNWQREIARFTPGLRVLVYHGGGRGGPVDADLVLTTYGLAARDIDRLCETTWDRVVLDEAQHVKNSASVTAQAIRRLPVRHRVALTGTPVENRVAELWAILDFLNPGAWGTASRFRARYSVPIERYNDHDAAARLRREIRPYVLRRLKSDAAVIADLPSKWERVQWCALTTEQTTLYRAVVEELTIRLKEGHAGPSRKGLVLAAMTKLKQACNHPAHLLGDGSAIAGRSGKVERLEEILTTALAEGDRALVFTQFTRFGAMLQPYLRSRLGVPVDFLHGGTTRGERDALVRRFQAAAGPGVLLASLKAGGTGLNLTAANHVIHLDRWWNPAAENQATDRAYRIGQHRDVQVHTFVCLGTIEERIEQMLADKTTVAQVALGTGEAWLASLSTEDLLTLVRLDEAGHDG